MKLPQNIENFLVEFETYTEKTVIQNGILIITLKAETTYQSPETHSAFIKHKKELREKYHFETKQVIKTKPGDADERRFGIARIDAVEEHIDVASMIVERLRAFFSPEMEFQSIVDSVGFLVSQGWSDTKIQNETGATKSTFHRYKSKSQEPTTPQTPTQNGTSPKAEVEPIIQLKGSKVNVE